MSSSRQTWLEVLGPMYKQNRHWELVRRRMRVAQRTARIRCRLRGAVRLGCPGLLAVTASVLGIEGPAYALQGGEDPSTLPVLMDKQSGLAGVLQLSALFSTTLATKYTESTGATLNVQYNFVDQLGVELTAGLFAAEEAQVLSEIRAQLAGEAEGPRDPRVSDMHQMQWLTALNVIWVPLYGKISFASEWNPTFDLYLLAGGGVVGTQRGVATGTNVQPNTSETEVAPQFNFGGGFRIFFVPRFALRLDIRNYFYVDPDEGEPTFTGMGETIRGLTSALVGQVGFQVNFGGGR